MQRSSLFLLGGHTMMTICAALGGWNDVMMLLLLLCCCIAGVCISDVACEDVLAVMKLSGYTGTGVILTLLRML